MLFARSGTISKGLLPFPRTPSTRCALENLKINQVNLTWSGFKHPRFRRVSIDFLHIILDLFLGRIPRLGLSTSANTTLQKKMAIFCWDQCLGKRFTLRFSTISKKSLPKEIWTDYKYIYICVKEPHLSRVNSTFFHNGKATSRWLTPGIWTAIRAVWINCTIAGHRCVSRRGSCFFFEVQLGSCWVD